MTGFFFIRSYVSKKALEEHFEKCQKKKILSTWNFILTENIFQKMKPKKRVS